MANNLFSADAEIAVLSTIIKNPTANLDTDGLKYYMFSAISHQELFKLITEFREKNKSPDLPLIISNLEASNSLKSVGGKDYLEHLISKDFPLDNFTEYVRFVRDSFKSRSLISLASKIKPDTILVSKIDEAINEIRQQLDSLTQETNGATTVSISESTKPAFDEIVARTKNPGIRGSAWDMAEVDSMTGGKIGGELWYVGGRPGAGKSALICNSIIADGKSGIPCLLFEREMSRQSILERLVAIQTGIPLTNIRQGILTQKQVDLLFDGMNVLKTYPIYIDINFSHSDIGYLVSTINRYKKLHGIKVIYADYIQLLSERDEGATNELGRISRAMKIVANDLDICTIVASQLNRGVEMRDNKRPLLSDLRQSGNLEEDADFVIGLYRDEYYNKETTAKNLMEFIILKARNGPTGTLTLGFNSETNKIGRAE